MAQNNLISYHTEANGCIFLFGLCQYSKGVVQDKISFYFFLAISVFQHTVRVTACSQCHLREILVIIFLLQKRENGMQDKMGQQGTRRPHLTPSQFSVNLLHNQVTNLLAKFILLTTFHHLQFVHDRASHSFII